MDKTSTPSGPVATMADVRRGGDVVFFFFPLLTTGSLSQDRVCLVTGIYAAGSGTAPWSLKRGAFGHFFGEFGGVVSPSQQFLQLARLPATLPLPPYFVLCPIRKVVAWAAFQRAAGRQLPVRY